MAIKIRKAATLDLAALSSSYLALMKGNISCDSRLYAYEKKYVEGRRRRLGRKLHSRKVGIFVAEENGKYCGYLLVEQARHPAFLAKNEAHIDDLFVVPSMRKKGVGKLLLERAEGWAKEKGMDFLGVESDAENFPAAAAYKKAGFAPRRLRMIKWLD